MVFSSVPVYLDPPNWNQQFQGNLQGASVTSGGMELIPPSLAAMPQPNLNPGSGTAGSVRPGSMSERARMAKIPQPEAGLKCPRCDSTNTKFCYFNNYSLTQPRHFCKTCRRYWTRGGALRSVPVGGGCRRNRRTKSSKSASASASASASSAAAAANVNRLQDGASSTSSTASTGSRSTIPSSLFSSQSQLPFMASLHGLTDHYNQLGLGFAAGMQPLEPVDYHLGISSSSSGTALGLEHWRLPQIQPFPFLGRVEAPSSATPASQPVPVPGLYQFEQQAEGEGGLNFSGAAGLPKVTSAALITQMASVKMEDRMQPNSNSREFVGMSTNNNAQYWGGAGAAAGGANSGSGSCVAWATELASFNSTSSGNIL